MTKTAYVCAQRLIHRSRTGQAVMLPGCTAVGCSGLFWKSPSKRTHPCFIDKQEVMFETRRK